MESSIFWTVNIKEDYKNDNDQGYLGGGGYRPPWPPPGHTTEYIKGEPEEVGHDHVHTKSGCVAPYIITLYKNRLGDSFEWENMLKSTRKEYSVQYPTRPPLQLLENPENAVLCEANPEKRICRL